MRTRELAADPRRAPHRAWALLALLLCAGAAQAVPLSYGFTLGVAGSGGFTVRADADAPTLQYNGTQQELTAFEWNIPGVGRFDLADLNLFSLSNWNPATGLVANGGRVSMLFGLKANAQSDSGVSCAVCTLFSTIDWPSANVNGGLGLVRISATGSPCALPGGVCLPVTPVLTANAAPQLRLFARDVAEVPEPSSLALALLAVVGVPALQRLRSA